MADPKSKASETSEQDESTLPIHYFPDANEGKGLSVRAATREEAIKKLEASEAGKSED